MLISGIIVVLMIGYSLIPLSFLSHMGREAPGAMAPTGMFAPSFYADSISDWDGIVVRFCSGAREGFEPRVQGTVDFESTAIPGYAISAVSRPPAIWS